ncbi:MAG: hypothetical protein FJ291_10305 [Planctomycetes bacterium]|nr:hypothetical protein [Planctomycetota bacterium]
MIFILVVVAERQTRVDIITMASSDAKPHFERLKPAPSAEELLRDPTLALVRQWDGRNPGREAVRRECAAWLRDNREGPPPEPPYDPNAYLSKIGLRHANTLPTRLAEGPGGRLYVTDPRVGSVFIYDSDLRPVAELAGLATPLGVAVAPNGAIYVGCKGSKSVEIYDSQGNKLGSIGAGAIEMPNDLALDRQGTLYVADSKANAVKVYDATGLWLGDLGLDSNEGGLLFPSAVTVAYRIDIKLAVEVPELYVADQGHSRIRVYDLAGNLLRAYGGATPAFFGNWKGKFARLQSLAVDALGQVHAADCYMNNVQVLDALTGAYIRDYGSFGTGQGQLNVPLDIVLTSGGRMIVANSGNRRVESISSGP